MLGVLKGDIFFSLKASRVLIKAKNVIFQILKMMKGENDVALFKQNGLIVF
jgi:hypothetical protein